MKKIIFSLILASYAMVATFGNSVLLRELLNSGDKHYHLSGENTSHPLPGSPVWSVKSPINQIFYADQSLHITPEETIINPDRLLLKYHVPFFQSKYTHLESLPSKPRDPPLA